MSYMGIILLENRNEEENMWELCKDITLTLFCITTVTVPNITLAALCKIEPVKSRKFSTNFSLFNGMYYKFPFAYMYYVD